MHCARLRSPSETEMHGIGGVTRRAWSGSAKIESLMDVTKSRAGRSSPAPGTAHTLATAASKAAQQKRREANISGGFRWGKYTAPCREGATREVAPAPDDLNKEQWTTATRQMAACSRSSRTTRRSEGTNPNADDTQKRTAAAQRCLRQETGAAPLCKVNIAKDRAVAAGRTLRCS